MWYLTKLWTILGTLSYYVPASISWYYSKPAPPSRVNDPSDIEWLKNYKDPRWMHMMKNVQKFLVEHQMDPLEYVYRIGADAHYILGIFDHRCRPYYNVRAAMGYYRQPNMDLTITKDDAYVSRLINSIYTDIINELGIKLINLSNKELLILNMDVETIPNTSELIKLITQVGPCIDIDTYSITTTDDIRKIEYC